MEIILCINSLIELLKRSRKINIFKIFTIIKTTLEIKQKVNQLKSYNVADLATAILNVAKTTEQQTEIKYKNEQFKINQSSAKFTVFKNGEEISIEYIPIFKQFNIDERKFSYNVNYAEKGITRAISARWEPIKENIISIIINSIFDLSELE